MVVGMPGDLHEPFSHPMYERFVQDVFEAWDVNEVVFAGDIVDNHAISFHETDPNGLGADEEARLAREGVNRWVRLFPKARVCIGNHDALHYRRAKREGIPDRFMKEYQEVWGTPNWDWQLNFIIEDVLYRHGTGSSGKFAAINQAIQRRISVAQGHTHSYAGVVYHTNDRNRIFGFNVGCGIDIGAYSFAYGKDFPNRPVLGCGVIADGIPYFEPMACGPGEKYHRSRAPKKRRIFG